MSLDYNEQVFIEDETALPKTVEEFNKFANSISKATFNQTIHTILTALNVFIITKVEQTIQTCFQADKFYKEHPELIERKQEVAAYIDKLKLQRPEMTVDVLFSGNGSYKGLYEEFKLYFEGK